MIRRERGIERGVKTEEMEETQWKWKRMVMVRSIGEGGEE